MCGRSVHFRRGFCTSTDGRNFKSKCCSPSLYRHCSKFRDMTRSIRLTLALAGRTRNIATRLHLFLYGSRQCALSTGKQVHASHWHDTARSRSECDYIGDIMAHDSLCVQDYEEVTIPPARPVPPRSTEHLIAVSELDPLCKGSFPVILIVHPLVSVC